MLGLAVLLLTVHPLLVLGLLVTVAPLAWSNMTGGRDYYRNAVRRTPRRRIISYLQYLLTMLDSAKETRAFGLAPYLMERFRSLREQLRGERLKISRKIGAIAAYASQIGTLFGDAGFPIDAPDPSRWYLRMPAGATLPAFPGPEEALGTDLFDALVGTGPTGDAVARRWRTLLSEAQVILHNHPWNERRAAAGLAPVNSLWFWGGGALPDHVSSPVARVLGGDVLVRALTMQAGLQWQERGNGFEPGEGDCLVDLGDVRDLAVLCDAWLLPALAALQQGALRELRLDFADGAGCSLLRKHRWRVWRGAASGFAV